MVVLFVTKQCENIWKTVFYKIKAKESYLTPSYKFFWMCSVYF